MGASGLVPGQYEGGLRLQSRTAPVDGRIDYLLAPLHLDFCWAGKSTYHFRAGAGTSLPATFANTARFAHPLPPILVQHHIKGDRNYTNEIRRVLSLELAHRLSRPEITVGIE